MLQSNDIFSDFRIIRTIHTGTYEEDQKKFHRFHELYYITEGKCAVMIGRRVYRLQAGDIAVVPALTLHKTDYLSYGPNVKYVVSLTQETAEEIDAFLGENVASSCFTEGCVTVPIQRRETLSGLLNRMYFESDNSVPHSHSVAKTCLIQLLISVLRYRSNQTEEDGIIDVNAERIHQIASFIYDHVSEEVSLSQLSRHFALSQTYLSRTFKRATGFGIKEYLVNLRIQKACELLLNTQLSITAISEKCGFNDSNYFGDAFKKSIGVSPREYRKLG